MFNSVYSTTPCRDYPLEKIRDGIAKASIISPQSISGPSNNNEYKHIVWLITPTLSEIPAFAHPFVLINCNGKREEISRVPESQIPNVLHSLQSFQTIPSIYIDVRNFTRLNQDGTVSVTSVLDYELSLMRALLTAHCLKESEQDLLSLTNLPLVIYTRWITEQLTRRLALPPEVQVRVTILVAFYYLSQFYSGDLNESDYIKIASQIAKATFISVEQILPIIEPVKRLTDANSLVLALITQGNSVRFEKFNLALLSGILVGSWFGFNNRELINVAVEHPPTFIAILYAAVNERGYRNTIIGRLVKEYAKGDIDKTFTKAVDSLIKVR